MHWDRAPFFCWCCCCCCQLNCKTNYKMNPSLTILNLKEEQEERILFWKLLCHILCLDNLDNDSKIRFFFFFVIQFITICIVICITMICIVYSNTTKLRLSLQFCDLTWMQMQHNRHDNKIKIQMRFSKFFFEIFIFEFLVSLSPN